MGTLVEDLGIPESMTLVGLSEDEIGEVQADQGVSVLPSRYVEFLRVMGRRAGALLVGTDAFYPAILGSKQYGLELLAECGVSHLVPEDAIIFALHQGYEVYWMPCTPSDDPPVFMYQEGDEGISGQWTSFTEFLRYELAMARIL